MRASIVLVFCVLSCFCSKLASCEVVGQEETSLYSHSCLNVSMQVEKASEDVQNVTEKIKAYVSHKVLTTTEDFLKATENSSGYSIGLHVKSLNLMLTMKVTLAQCEKYNGTGRSEYGKILTGKDGIQVSVHYNSSVTYTDHGDADTATTAFHSWITWPFKSLTSKMVVVYNFWADKAMRVFQCIAWPFKILKNNIVAAYECVADFCGFLNQKVTAQFEDPIQLMEAVLEVVWMVVYPYVRVVTWVCEIIIDIKRNIKLEIALFLEKYPAVLECIATCKMIRENVSEILALWPWNWMDSIEYIGYTWVILYFSIALIKFAMMDERQMIRMAKLADRKGKRH